MIDRLRILYVDTEPVWRGGQEQLLSLVLGMRDQGHHVAVAAPRSTPLAARILEKGIRFHPFRQRAELSPLAFARMYKILRKDRFSIVHFNTQRPLIAGALASRIAGSPITVCSRRVNFPLPTRLSALKFNLLIDSVVTVSSSIKRTLARGRVNSDIVRVIHEGVDFQDLDRLQAPQLSLPDDKRIIGTVAHLSPEKDHLTLIKAFQTVKKNLQDALLVIVGDGELRSSLEQLVSDLGLKDSVCFTGFRSDAGAIMRHFDLFCLPSLSEGLSAAIMEAMANHLPVVTTRVGGNPELVIEGETGLLVEPGKPAFLADALEKLLRSPDLISKMGNAGRQRIERHFTLAARLAGFEKLYLELLAQRKFG